MQSSLRSFSGPRIKYTPQKVNRKDGNEMTGATRSDPKAHMQNFLDSIRGSKQGNCPFEIGFPDEIFVSGRLDRNWYQLGFYFSRALDRVRHIDARPPGEILDAGRRFSAEVLGRKLNAGLFKTQIERIGFRQQR